jgi:4-amino-4-deoxy-L-arabinose transferase-like glycosyltransferase
VVNADVATNPGPCLRQPPRFDWLTPARCRIILALLLATGFLGNLHYLTQNCPIDLSGDEAHYWDWSRRLDLSYYSKGPLVAYIIRASCNLVGRDVMWAVRLPALVLAIGTGLVTYLLTLNLFKSDRVALGAVLLNASVPMFIAGSVLMTIDPSFFFCWALSTYLLAHAIFDDRRWVWPLIGIVVGVGSLAKYGMLLWLPTMLLTLWVDRPSRRRFGTIWPWLAAVIALSFLTPVLIWNQQHGWVTFRHVATQTGTDTAKHFAPLNFLEFIGSQIGVVGPPVVAMMIGAGVYAWFVREPTVAVASEDAGQNEKSEPLVSTLDYASVPKKAPTLRERLRSWARLDPNVRQARFLLAVGLPFFTLTFLDSFRTKVQPNWPAPAYFTLIILAAYFISTRMRDAQRWRRWRMWVQGAVITGAVATPLLPHTDWLYPVVVWQHKVRHAKGEVPPASKFDPSSRAKGWQEAAARVSGEMKTLRRTRSCSARTIRRRRRWRSTCRGSRRRTAPGRISPAKSRSGTASTTSGRIVRWTPTATRSSSAATRFTSVT